MAAELEGARLADRGAQNLSRIRTYGKQLDAAAAAQDIEWHWVKGHSGHEGNEYVDQLANPAIDRMLAAN